jgi:chemotaxis methyl-accepting protein methylase
VNVDADPGFLALARRIASTTGLDLGAYKDRCLRRRIAVRMRACGVLTYGEYVAVLDHKPEELERLLDALTINVTKVYRNPETWSYLEREVLPSLVEAREGRVRIWSAGCASGEESYTLAMVLAEALDRVGHREWRERVNIDATDIDKLSLERARLAEYPERVFSETPPALVKRYWERVGPDLFRLDPSLRDMVSIRRHDLLGEAPPVPHYDMILCRNVIIYFDRANQERLMLMFLEALAPGGFLVLGKVETIFGAARERLELIEPRERIYRRPA